MKPLPPKMPIWSMRSSQTLSVSPHSPSVVGEKAHSAEPPTAGKVKFTPPNARPKPTSQKPMAPMQNTIMFIIIVWATFLARVKPVSTRAKPACMKKIRKPATSIHITLIAVARSSVVGPVLSAEAMPVKPTSSAKTRSGRIRRRVNALRMGYESSFKECV